MRIATSYIVAQDIQECSLVFREIHARRRSSALIAQHQVAQRTCHRRVAGTPSSVSLRASHPAARTAIAWLLATLITAKDAMATESPKYRVTTAFKGFEIREYSPQLVAETEVEGPLEDAGNRAFGLLAGYIFGKNKGDKKIAMTAPVTQSTGSKIAMTSPVTQAASANHRFVVRFTMPNGYTLQTLPEPLDSRVRLVEVPGKQLAVLRYTGTWSRRNYDAHVSVLREALTAQGVNVVGEPIWARYDPPWTPWFMRHNEIMWEVASDVR
jgi:SOUL heme-binding protein